MEETLKGCEMVIHTAPNISNFVVIVAHFLPLIKMPAGLYYLVLSCAGIFLLSVVNAPLWRQNSHWLLAISHWLNYIFCQTRAEAPKVIRAPRSRNDQITLTFSATKPPFSKGRFGGNVTQWCSLLRVIIDEVALSSIMMLGARITEEVMSIFLYYNRSKSTAYGPSLISRSSIDRFSAKGMRSEKSWK